MCTIGSHNERTESDQQLLRISIPAVDKSMSVSTNEFDKAFRSSDRIQGYTHDFYKYPARFSPSFVRLVLNALTNAGDYVLDPFMGGGTTIVEAAASGRHAIGSDVNELAHFVTRVKTTPLSRHDIADIRKWVKDVTYAVEELELAPQPICNPIKNLPAEVYPFFATATSLITRLQFPRRQRFARCALVRVGQWALDARSNTPEVAELRDQLECRVEGMLNGLSNLVAAARDKGIHKNRITAVRRLLSCSAADSLLARTMQLHRISPKLVLTSPPYPGVHMLYHRWQVFGRRETPAPYWIADIRDGHGASHYTMGSRSTLGLRSYFREISAAFGNLKQVISPEATVIQLISFSDSTVQLPQYLDAMISAGFEETSVGPFDSRQVRSVPNRKWYNQGRTENDASRELLLVHRPIT